jgi:hypothetical protein
VVRYCGFYLATALGAFLAVEGVHRQHGPCVLLGSVVVIFGMAGFIWSTVRDRLDETH